MTLAEAAGQVASCDNPELAEAAAEFLENTLGQKAGLDGEPVQAFVGEIRWEHGSKVGRGEARILDDQWTPATTVNALSRELASAQDQVKARVATFVAQLEAGEAPWNTVVPSAVSTPPGGCWQPTMRR